MRNGPIRSIGLIQVEINEAGTIYHLRNGVFHRTDGPALITTSGTEEWWLDGISHRIGGPSFKSDVIEEWSQYDILHRTDGPAVTYSDGVQEFWVKGVQYRPTSDGLPDLHNPIEESIHQESAGEYQ